jgi:hypothetical protein
VLLSTRKLVAEEGEGEKEKGEEEEKERKEG